MASDEDTRTRHPVPAGVHALAAGLTALAERPLFSLDAATTRDTVLELADLKSRLAAYEYAVLAHAERVQVGAETGCTSTGVWAANATRTRKNVAAAQVRLAVALDGRWHRVRDALAAGAMNPDQARVVITALEDLPEDLDAALVATAEEALVGYAADFDPQELQTLGAHVLTLIAPEVGEDIDRKRLEEQERKAAHKRRLSLTFDGHGSAHGRFTLPTAQGQMLHKLLLAFASPGHLNATTDETGHGREWVTGRPSAQKLGEAFCELIETYPRTAVPDLGGFSGTVVVTTTLADLRHDIGTAILDTGGQITVAQARRLACEAMVIPVVLGGAGQVLDAGRARRFYTPTQRLAMAVRDGGCTARGCDWPPGLCHAHHDQRWVDGGKTDLKDGRLLCAHHHARAHDPAYAITTHADNQVTFHRRT